jgi:hypothetical protein
MSDFETNTLTDDWSNVLASGGSLTFALNGVTPSGIWAAQFSDVIDAEEQLRDERRFTVFTTVASCVTIPADRTTLERDGVTYFIDAVRSDAESVGIELDVRKVF